MLSVIERSWMRERENHSHGFAGRASLNIMRKSSEKKTGLIIFSDFDGTISQSDVGNRMFHHFSAGKSDVPVERWRNDEIDSRQCLLEEAALMRDVTESELLAYIDSFEIDESFKVLADFARRHNLPLYVLSDGLDFYINRLLRKNHLDYLPVSANQARLEQGRLKIICPYFDNSCGNCGNCKGYHVRRLSGEDQIAVYIGDGKSDLCALPEADLVFAKAFLADYCRRSEIDFVFLNNFANVTSELEKRYAHLL